MELKIYTKSHDIKSLRKETHNDVPFTSIEKSRISSKESIPNIKELYKRVLECKEELSQIIKFIERNDIKKIVSIGSSYPIQEYYISKKTGIEILCFDFDKPVIENTKLIFKNKISLEYYDMNTPLNNIIELEDKIDCIIFFHSLYIFKNEQYEKYLEQVKKMKIKYIIDHTAFISTKSLLRGMISHLVKSSIYPILQKFFPKSDRFYMGKFHGFTRNKSSLEKIYSDSNLRIIKSFKKYFFLKYI